MSTKKKWLVLLVLACVAVIIRVISANPGFVESYYSTGIYPHIAATLRYMFGWLPFSIGDVLYALLLAWALIKMGNIIRKIFRRAYSLAYFKTKLYPLAVTILLVYIAFNILWGINYNRKGITYQLGIKTEKYTTAELALIDSVLVAKVNESKTSLARQQQQYLTTAQTFDAAKKAYDTISRQYPWLVYKPASAKTSLWGWAGNYMGFTGYYNPFTGEAQLNTTVPKFIQPFTTCHEMAHQLGYAKENEANFVGYLAAAASTDTLLHYSTYLDLYLYAQKNLYIADSGMAKHFSKQLLPQVKDDLKELRAFYEAHQSPLEPLFKWLYEKYLEHNQQPSGLLTYDEVTGFLIAYHKKFGRI
jgi:hypothetical protein